MAQAEQARAQAQQNPANVALVRQAQIASQRAQQAQQEAAHHHNLAQQAQARAAQALAAVEALKTSNLAMKPLTVSFRSYHNKYFVNEGNGGASSTVNANRDNPGPWETMALGKLGQGCIKTNDQVAIQTGGGYYWRGYGDGNLMANSTAVGPEERFFLVNHTRQGCLENNDIISLRGAYNKYVVAEGDGRANANRDAIGPWEQIMVIFH